MNTLISDIHAAMTASRKFTVEPGCDVWGKDRPRKLELAKVVDDLQDAAELAFAKLNGWKSTLSMFSPEQIGTSGRSYSYELFFDHPLYFQIGRCNAAIVTQPYRKISEMEAYRPWAAGLGLALHIPPDPLASFWYPGYAIFAVLTAAGTAMQWLPEQDGRLETLWRRTPAGDIKQQQQEEKTTALN